MAADAERLTFTPRVTCPVSSDHGLVQSCLCSGHAQGLFRKRTQGTPLSPNLLRKDASADVLRGSEKTHSGQDVPVVSDVATMCEVRACARALVQRIAEGGEIPIASLHELAEVALRSELVAVSHQVLDGPPEFALRRAMELSGLILAVVVKDEGEEEEKAAK